MWPRLKERAVKKSREAEGVRKQSNYTKQAIALSGNPRVLPVVSNWFTNDRPQHGDGAIEHISQFYKVSTSLIK